MKSQSGSSLFMSRTSSMWSQETRLPQVVPQVMQQISASAGYSTCSHGFFWVSPTSSTRETSLVSRASLQPPELLLPYLVPGLVTGLAEVLLRVGAVPELFREQKVEESTYSLINKKVFHLLEDLKNVKQNVTTRGENCWYSSGNKIPK